MRRISVPRRPVRLSRPLPPRPPRRPRPPRVKRAVTVRIGNVTRTYWI